MLSAASDEDALIAQRAAREAFGRVLSTWASDILEIRRLGLDRAEWRAIDAGEAHLRRAA
jgi:hypothetical protein